MRERGTLTSAAVSWSARITVDYQLTLEYVEIVSNSLRVRQIFPTNNDGPLAKRCAQIGK